MFIKTMRPIYRMAEGDAGGAAGGAGAGGAAGGTAPWYDGFDPEIKGHMQTLGWDKKKPEEVALEASKAHIAAQKFVGAPADKLLRIPDERPTDTTETKARHQEEWNKIWERLGKPKEAKDYDFSNIKYTGDKPITDALRDVLRQAAFEGGLTKDAAIKVAGVLVKAGEQSETTRQALEQDKLTLEKTELKKNWGNNEAANNVIAEAAMKALGFDPLTLKPMLEKTAGDFGYAKLMNMFLNIGTKIGEDRFVNGGQGPNIGPLTKDQALAEREALKSDKAWGARYLAGGLEERRKMEALNRIISGVGA